MTADAFDPKLALQRVYDGCGEEERRLLFPALESDDGRGLYVEWLERNDPRRAEALRLAERLDGADDPAAARRLGELREGLDPSWWWLFQRARIRNCGGGRGRPVKLRFRLLCPESWTTLTPTGEAGVRRCERCEERVYRCAGVDEANERARQGQCIAVDPALASEGAGPDAKLVILGRPDYVAMWADHLFPGEPGERPKRA